jgi:hypothetical protein
VIDSRSALVIVLGAMLVVAGCSKASGGATADVGSPAAPSAGSSAVAGSTGPAAATAPSASAPAAGGAVAAVNVCAILPTMVAAKATGVDLDSAAPDPSGPGQYGCTYSSDGDSAADIEDNPDIVVYTSASPMTLDGLKDSLDAAASQDGPTVAVSGVGDKAYAGAGGVIAQAGNHLIDVSGMAGDLTGDHSMSTALAKAVISALG